MGILTLISSQRHPKMDSEGDSESSEFEEKAGRKILLAKKKVPPHSCAVFARAKFVRWRLACDQQKNPLFVLLSTLNV